MFDPLLSALSTLLSSLFYPLLLFNATLLALNVGLRWWAKQQQQQQQKEGGNRTQRSPTATAERRQSAAGDGGTPTRGGAQKAAEGEFSPQQQFNASISHRSTSGTSNKARHKLLAVMGSGGHTTEMLKLLASTTMSSDCMFPVRVYVCATSDQLSGRKVLDFEQQLQQPRTNAQQQQKGGSSDGFRVLQIPRAREVGQSYVSSVGTTLVAAYHSLMLILEERPDIILCNGPSIGFNICLFARLLELFRVHRCRIVFVESICRVHSLSLTGRLLYNLRIPHAFLVQWPDLQQKYPRAEFMGRLI